MMTITPKKVATAKRSNGIAYNGANTIHQDQAIYPINLRVMKIKPKIPKKLIIFEILIFPRFRSDADCPFGIGIWLFEEMDFITAVNEISDCP